MASLTPRRRAADIRGVEVAAFETVKRESELLCRGSPCAGRAAESCADF